MNIHISLKPDSGKVST